MKKYEEMVAVNRAVNKEKTRQALRAIQNLREEGEEITVRALQNRTGLSRGFFYKNERVREALEKAREESDHIPEVHPKQIILNRAMEKQLQMMEKQMQHLRQENEALKTENMLWKATLENLGN